MLKDQALRKIIINASILTGGVLLIFLIASYWYYSLLVGWAIGAFLAIGSFFIKGWITKRIFGKDSSSRTVFFLSILNSFLHLFIFGIAIFIILEINYAYIGKIFIVDDANATTVVSGPINLFTFIAGMHVIMISIFISHISKNNSKKGKVDNHENI